MKYIIQIWALGAHPEIELDDEKFKKLKHARKCLSNALAIEEKYELLLSNYLDLEKECLIITSDYMVRSNAGYAGFFDIRLAFNRRIVNLLTSTKLYIDQIQQHVRACISDDDMIDKIKKSFSHEYDTCFEYRFMEALRNYVQHRGLAVHSTALGGRKVTNEKNCELEYKTKVLTHKSEVETDNAFKKQISNEMTEKVDLMYASRVYVESISRVHCYIRKLLGNVSESSRKLISHYINEYEEINNGNSVGLNAVSFNTKEPIDEAVEKIPLLLDWDDIRLNLITKNGELHNLRRKFVSGSAL